MFFSQNLSDSYIKKCANKNNNLQIYFLPIFVSLVMWDLHGIGSQWDPAVISHMGPTWFPHGSH